MFSCLSWPFLSAVLALLPFAAPQADTLGLHNNSSSDIVRISDAQSDSSWCGACSTSGAIIIDLPSLVEKIDIGSFRKSSAELTSIWDARTLATFTLSQIDAFVRILSGRCPLLSRAVQCSRHGGIIGTRPGERPLRWREFIAAYLEEEAELCRRQAVAMMRHIWTNYEARAFGKDELRPISGDGVDSWGSLGQTLVDSLDTLWLLGFREEFDRAAEWVEAHLNFDIDINVNLFETSIRQLGGLLAAHWLSGRKELLSKAEELAQRLLSAYSLPRPELSKRSEKKSPKAAPPVLSKKGRLAELFKHIGLDTAAASLAALGDGLGLEGFSDIEIDSLEAMADSSSPSPITSKSPKEKLPYSDIHLQTGLGQNLGGFVSLAEAYTPCEWKALAMLTGNCSYAEAPDQVLRIVNATSNLETRGLGPIMLRSDGSAYASEQNRISLGSRGDSFYEYLLKDWVQTGKVWNNTLTRNLWDAFRTQFPSLLVETDPVSLGAKLTGAHGTGQARENFDGFSRWLRHRAGRRRKTRRRSAPGSANRKAVNNGMAGGGRVGGWFEDASDTAGPWVFVREVTSQQSIPKMDHLLCFLPGAFALDVYHSSAGSNVTALSSDLVSELLTAHKLVQTCVHMYFRTASDLAPEITRFNAWGLTDDLGSMHNILRPETIESLFLLWRTTKAQIYRNWGQRLLSAFARTRTKYAFASLDNVNKPGQRRDDMPSFFVAETIKYLYLLFAPDSALSFEENVLNTEAHPLPVVNAHGDTPHRSWKCHITSGTPPAKPLPTPSAKKPSASSKPLRNAPSPPRRVVVALKDLDYVVVTTAFKDYVVSLSVGDRGQIMGIDESGDALVKFETKGTHWIFASNFDKLTVLPGAPGSIDFDKDASLATPSPASMCGTELASARLELGNLKMDLLGATTAYKDSATTTRELQEKNQMLEDEAAEWRSAASSYKKQVTALKAELQQLKNAGAEGATQTSDASNTATASASDSDVVGDYIVTAAAGVTAGSSRSSQLVVELQPRAELVKPEPIPPGDSACWIAALNFDTCCFPSGIGNPLCWDADYDYKRCCL